MKNTLPLLLGLTLFLCLSRCGDPGETVADSRFGIAFELGKNDAGELTYTVRKNDREIISTSRLGMVIDGRDIGADAEITGHETSKIEERFSVLGNYSSVSLSGERHVYDIHAGNLAYQLEVRIFEHGLGFRYLIPDYAGAAAGAGRLTEERTAFNLRPGATIYAADDYEGYWEATPLAEFQDTNDVALPLVAAYTDREEYVLISEAMCLDYLAVGAKKNGPASFGLVFGRREIYQQSMPVTKNFRTPWRVVMVNDDLNGLVNNPLVLALADAPDPELYADTDWIRPGRAGWTWVSGGFRGQTVENMKRQIPAAGALNWEYLIIDDGWEHWPDKWERVRELAELGREHNVGLLLWKPTGDYQAAWQIKKFGWQDTIRGIMAPEARRDFFRKAAAAGVAGLKVDFVEEYNLERVNVVRDILEDAARERLIINFHGSSKPSGLERTYPNLIVQEAVRGMENTWISGDDFYHYNTVLPFTRYVVGTGDFTPYRGEAGKAGSLAHQLATCVVFNAPLNALAASPVQAVDDPAADFLRVFPTVWDETRVLPPSKIGEVAVFAKRKGDDWYVAAINGRRARTLTLRPADFGLSPTDYAIEQYTDGPDGTTLEHAELSATESYGAALRPGGGWVVRFVRK